MLRVDISAIDSLFIARHILAKLDLPTDSISVEKAKLPMKKGASDTARSIEKIEDTWDYKAKNDIHSFGRKEKNETIKLWSVPHKSAQVLRDLVILTGAKNILEIGTSAGYSTLFLADGAKHNRGRVTTIEFLHEKAKMARKFFANSELNNITLIEGEAAQVLKNWGRGEIDLVFLDADKENYAKYFKLLMPHLKKRAIIIADNINDYGHLMEDYLQLITGTHLPRSRTDKRVYSYYLAALDNGLTFTKKI